MANKSTPTISLTTGFATVLTHSWNLLWVLVLSSSGSWWARTPSATSKDCILRGMLYSTSDLHPLLVVHTVDNWYQVHTVQVHYYRNGATDIVAKIKLLIHLGPNLLKQSWSSVGYTASYRSPLLAPVPLPTHSTIRVLMRHKLERTGGKIHRYYN